VHVYRNGIRIAASTCSTGKPGHATPTGVFKILQKDKHHRSSTYNNAPMPNMNRLTWSGIALHAGNLPGYPASHGCVRLPLKFSELLFGVTKLGMTVVIADDASQPAEVVHPGLVLGDYAQHEFGAVETALLQDQYSQAHVETPSTTSIVVSRADRSIAVWENDRIVASGKALIEDPDTPIGDRVYTLQGWDDDQKNLHWAAADVLPRRGADTDTKTLQRIKAEPGLAPEIRKRLKIGMTLVTTDDSAKGKFGRSGFVVLDGVS
jgi:hypothetical protein